MIVFPLNSQILDGYQIPDGILWRIMAFILVITLEIFLFPNNKDKILWI